MKSRWIRGRPAARVLLMVVLAATAVPAVAPAQTVGRVHALLVVDTATRPPLAGLDKDLRNIETVLRRGLPRPGQLQLTILTDAQVSAETILAYYRSVPVQPEDTLFFYYSGHGATDPTRGHFLEPQNGRVLPRYELRAAMMARNPRLVVLLSDCCSNRKTLGAKAPAARAPTAAYAGESPVQARCRQLLLAPRGTVDINSSSYDPDVGHGQVSWGDDGGGLFTSAFTSIMLDPSPSAGPLEWSHFSTELRRRTSDLYSRFRQDNLAPPRTLAEFEMAMLREQPSQTPQFFADEVHDGPGTAGGSPYRLGLEVHENGGQGVRISTVADGSPAHQRGFEVGDIVLRIDGWPINSEQAYARAIDHVGPRGTVRIDVRNVQNGRILRYIDVQLAH